MQSTVMPDRLTVIAIAVMAYASANISHELVGHCGTAVLVGTKCTVLSSEYIPLAEMPETWKYNIIVASGCKANWAIGLLCFGLLRGLRTTQAMRYFLWLSMCVNLFLASAYVAAAPVIKYGDSYILMEALHGQLFWRSAVALAGAVACWLSFRLCQRELSRLMGCVGRDARSIAWRLVVPAYIAGGIVTVASALFSRLEFKLAQLQAAGGTFGLTIWLLLLPLTIPAAPEPARHPFTLARNTRWIVLGALTALTFIFVLGPGIPL